MTDEQWQQLEKYVKHVAVEQLRDYIKQLIEEKKVGKEEKMQNQEQRFDVEVVREALKRYRTEPEGSRIRKCIDWLIKRHADFEGVMQQDDTFRIRHNAIVLEYIIKKPMTHIQIEKKLGISDGTFKRYIDTGVKELADILFLNYISDNSA